MIPKGKYDYDVYVTDTYDDRVRLFYKAAHRELMVNNRTTYVNDPSIYQDVSDVSALAYILHNVNDEYAFGHIITKYDWMPDNFIKIFTRLYTFKEHSERTDRFRYTKQEVDIIRDVVDGFQLPSNFIFAKNLNNKITVDNYQRHTRVDVELFRRHYKTDCNAYPSLCMLNHTPQMVWYGNLQNESVNVDWLEEFAFHDD